MSQAAAIRRRRQAKNGFKHMAPLRRPHYAQYSQERSQKALKRAIENAKRGIAH